MIYQGSSAESTGTNAEIGRSVFNSGYTSNLFVGFQYSGNNVHGTGTKSTILGVLNTWYTNNLGKEGIKDKLAMNAGFCNDREPSTSKTESNGAGGIGTDHTYYGAFIRLYSTYQTKQTPTFKCKNSSDLFTVGGELKSDGITQNGNGALVNPIGLITADEVVYAGGYWGTANSSYYLYTGQTYWTISPFESPYSNMLGVYLDGSISSFIVNSNSNNGVRPVINLKADTKFKYNNESTKGTMSDPYIVE